MSRRHTEVFKKNQF